MTSRRVMLLAQQDSVSAGKIKNSGATTQLKCKGFIYMNGLYIKNTLLGKISKIDVTEKEAIIKITLSHILHRKMKFSSGVSICSLFQMTLFLSLKGEEICVSMAAGKQLYDNLTNKVHQIHYSL